jgi:hypothetical protein
MAQVPDRGHPAQRTGCPLGDVRHVRSETERKYPIRERSVSIWSSKPSVTPNRVASSPRV